MVTTDFPTSGTGEFSFDLTYDGAALSQHEMDVRDLAPALLSTANLFRSLNRELHPTDPDVQVNIKATGEGSFLLQLKLLYEQMQNVIGNHQLNSDEGLAGLFVILIQLIRYVRKRGRSGPPTAMTPIDGTDVLIRAIWADGTQLEITRDALRMADNPAVRSLLRDVIRPVSRFGIDILEFRRSGQNVPDESVSKEDLPSLDAPVEAGREILNVFERDTYLTVRAPAFDPSLKWRFYDGIVNFAAPIVDAEFLARMGRREESFAVGDVLYCSLRTTQWRDSQGIHSEIEIVTVHGHLPPADPHPTIF